MSIIWDPKEATTIVEVPFPVITTGTQNMGNGVYWLKAGTPLDDDLAVSNDDDAVYVVAEDFFFISTNPNQDRHVPIITGGYVDLNKAEAASGLTYTDDCIDALADVGIVVVDDLLEAGGGTNVVANPTLAGTEDSLTGIQIGDTKYAVGGSSGGGMLVVTDTEGTLDKTAQEIMTAAENGLVVVKKTEGPATNVFPILQFTFNTITGYDFTVFNGDWAEYVASSADDYPEIDI